MNSIDICPICKRECGGKMEAHHLKPVTFKTRTREVHGKDNLVTIHSICHQKIHSTFSEKELLDYYHTVERLTEHEEMQKFITWVKKKPTDFYSKNDDTKSRKKKRRR
jgi:hypothetical protein